jgi:hypothetical protein
MAALGFVTPQRELGAPGGPMPWDALDDAFEPVLARGRHDSDIVRTHG